LKNRSQDVKDGRLGADGSLVAQKQGMRKNGPHFDNNFLRQKMFASPQFHNFLAPKNVCFTTILQFFSAKKMFASPQFHNFLAPKNVCFTTILQFFSAKKMFASPQFHNFLAPKNVCFTTFRLFCAKKCLLHHSLTILRQKMFASPQFDYFAPKNVCFTTAAFPTRQEY
jgi:hypothetical protein